MKLILMTVSMMMGRVRNLWMDIGDFKNGELLYIFLVSVAVTGSLFFV